MLRHVARCRAGAPRIIRHLDLPPERVESRALVECDRGRMVEGAGVQPDAADLARPGDLERAVHQDASRASADQFCGDAEINQLAVSALAEIEFEQAFVA